MKTTIITASETKSWSEWLHKLPVQEQDVMSTPEWYRFFEGVGYGEALCFCGEEEGRIALYPFLRNSINALGYELEEDYYDIQGAPGYNGILSTTEDRRFLQRYRENFNGWCAENNIIAEFSRCNPVTGNHRRLPAAAIFEANISIIVTLQPEEEIFINYDRSRRKKIRKAEREGLSVQVFTGESIAEEMLKAFAGIYSDTMDRNKADPEYRHDLHFFRTAAESMRSQLLFFFTMYQNAPVSALAVVAGSAAAYSWLGGTLSEYYPLRPNDILMDRIIDHLRGKGLQHYCLGGGLTPGDSIFGFKRSFAVNGEVPFFIAKKIHRPDVYGEILQQWQSKHPEMAKIYQNRILGYRETNPTNY